MLSNQDFAVGFRLNIIARRFEEFLSKLKAASINLIFVFENRRVNSPGFISELQRSCDETRYLVQMLVRGANLKNGEYYFPFNQAVMLVMSQVALRFGNLRGMGATQSLAATFNVRLANKYKAMAILGLNTDYIFFEGSWAFWSHEYLDIDSMNVLQYNKKNILVGMRLTTQQAPLFVALAGSLYSSETNRKLEKYFKSRNRDKTIKSIVKFINNRQLLFPISDVALSRIIIKIFKKCSYELFEDFKLTMLLMDTTKVWQAANAVDASILEHIKDDYANYAEEILKSSPICISPDYLDLRL